MIQASDIHALLVGADTEWVARTARLLRTIGLRDLTLAPGGADVLEALVEYKVDVAIVHVAAGAAGETGCAVLRSFRRASESANRYLPVVAAVADSADLKRVLDAGAHEIVDAKASGEMLLRRMANAIFIGWPFVETPTYSGPCRRRGADSRYAGPERRMDWIAPDQSRLGQEAHVARMVSYLRPL